MAITLVQSASTAGATTQAYGSSTTAGNMLIVIGSAGAAGAVCSDTAGNVWETALTPTTPPYNGNGANYIFYAPNCKGGASTVSLGGGSFRFTVSEWTGLTALDQTNQYWNGGVGVSSTWNTGAITTLYANEVLICYGACNYGGVGTPPTSFSTFTGGGGDQYGMAFYEIVSTIQTALTVSSTQVSHNPEDYGGGIASFVTTTFTGATSHRMPVFFIGSKSG